MLYRKNRNLDNTIIEHSGTIYTLDLQGKSSPKKLLEVEYCIIVNIIDAKTTNETGMNNLFSLNISHNEKKINVQHGRKRINV